MDEDDVRRPVIVDVAADGGDALNALADRMQALAERDDADQW